MKLDDEFYGNEHYVSKIIEQINAKIELEETAKQWRIQKKTILQSLQLNLKY